MRIRPSGKPIPYFNRKDQIRMLALVGLLALVLIGMKLAANPASWHWMFVGQNAADEPNAESGGPRTKIRQPRERPVDRREDSTDLGPRTNDKSENRADGGRDGDVH